MTNSLENSSTKALIQKKLSKPNLKKNDYLEVIISDYSHEGWGVAKYDSFTIFVEGAIPQEKCEVKIIKVEKNYAIAKLQSINLATKSKNRAEILDSKATWLGTMPLQHLTYDEQICFKEALIQRRLERNSTYSSEEIQACTRPLIKAEKNERLAYRCKAQVPVRSKDGLLSTGFFQRNSHNFFPVDNFYIQDKDIDALLIYLRNMLRDLEITAYDEKKKTGTIRHLIVKKTYHTEEIQIIIITSTANFLQKEKLKEKITQIFTNPSGLLLNKVKSIVWQVQKKETNVILGETQEIWHGNNFITDKLLKTTLRIGSSSFYQVNKFQTPKLYSLAFSLLEEFVFTPSCSTSNYLSQNSNASVQKTKDNYELSKTHIVLDAFCGIGSIGLCLLKNFQTYIEHLYGLEIVEEAITYAKQNAELNALVEKTSFMSGDISKVFSKWQDVAFTIAIVDPPRKGLDCNFIEMLANIPTLKHILYISCNVETLSRDLAFFKEQGFILKVVQGVDMFPHTPHVETIALLQRR